MKNIEKYTKEILLKKPIKELGLSIKITKKITDNGITIIEQLLDLKSFKKKGEQSNSMYEQSFNIENINLIYIYGIGQKLGSNIKTKVIELYYKIETHLKAFVDLSKVPNLAFESYYLLACKVLEIKDKDIPEKSIDCEGIAISLLTLTPIELLVLSIRFGLNENTQKAKKEIEKFLNMSSERLYAIEQRALKKLRHPSRVTPFKCNGKNFSIFTDPSSSMNQT